MFAPPNSGEGWQRVTLTLLVVLTFLCGVIVGALLSAGTCAELDSSGWGQYNPVQAAVSMWRTSQNPWVHLLAPGTAHASAAGALSFVGIGVSGAAYLLGMPGLGRLGQSMIRKYEATTAMNTQMMQELLKETKTPVRKIAARMSAGSPLVDSRKSFTGSPL